MKESRRDIWKVLEGGKERRKCYDYIIISKTTEAIESQIWGRVSNCTGDTGASQFQRFDLGPAEGRWCFHSASLIHLVFPGVPSTVIRHGTDRREESCSGDRRFSEFRMPLHQQDGETYARCKEGKTQVSSTEVKLEFT